MKKIVVAFAALACVAFSEVATAAPVVSDSAPAAQTMVQKAYYYRRWNHRWYGPRYGYYYGGAGYGYGYGGCRRARHICADRWGWGGPAFRRCLWRHGC
jgi:hypothetical protein